MSSKIKLSWKTVKLKAVKKSFRGFKNTFFMI